MGEIGIVGPGKTRGYPYPVCKKEKSQAPVERNILVQWVRIIISASVTRVFSLKIICTNHNLLHTLN